MKKILSLLFLLPNFVIAEVIHVDLICEGESALYCEDSKKCGTEPAVEIIKIAGNTLIHKIHGNLYMIYPSLVQKKRKRSLKHHGKFKVIAFSSPRIN